MTRRLPRLANPLARPLWLATALTLAAVGTFSAQGATRVQLRALVVTASIGPRSPGAAHTSASSSAGSSSAGSSSAGGSADGSGGSSAGGSSSGGSSSSPNSSSKSSKAGQPGSAASGPPAARCVPKQLNETDVLPGTQLQVSPLPDSFDASPTTQISLVGAPIQNLTVTSVIGSQTRRHHGRLMPYSQDDGANWVPNKPFSDGETVTVRGLVVQGTTTSHFAFRFTTDTPDPIGHSDVAAALTKPSSKTASSASATPTTPVPPTTGSSPSAAAVSQSFLSRPDLRPPDIAVTTPATSAVANGYIMATPYTGPGQGGTMIFDNSGQLVWFNPNPKGYETTNLQVQQYDGKPVLTWWLGYIPPQGFGQGEEMIVDSHYNLVARVTAGNGLQADLHDFRITGQNTGLMTVFNPIHCDLSSVAGPANSAVTDAVYQEIDLKTGLVRREWHALDHVPLSATYSHAESASLQWPLDYFHINSIDTGLAGKLLISSRNTWALYEISMTSGRIDMQIGGKNGTVKATHGTATAWQHDARALSNGDITVFDNGAVPAVHPQSRGLVLSINSNTDTASVVTEYTHSAALSAGSQGNFQTLANGNAFLGWGAQPYFSEFSPSGQLLFDAHMPTKYLSYRSFRFPWTGQPARPPALAVTSTTTGHMIAHASWNGATNVATWQVLAAASPGTLRPAAKGSRSGFETTIPTTSRGPYVEVQALDANGNVLATSDVVKNA